MPIETIVRAIQSAQGFLSPAAKACGVARRTMERWVKEYPEAAEARREVKEELLDFTESILLQKIKEKDFASIQLYLMTQGKDRGYVKRVQVEDFADVSDEEVFSRLGKLMVDLDAGPEQEE